MRTVTIKVLAALVCLSSMTASGCSANEKSEEGPKVSEAKGSSQEGEVRRDELPAKLIEAVEGKVPGAEIVSAYVENEGGELRYEITAKGRDELFALEVSEDGVVREFSEEVTKPPAGEGKAEQMEVTGGKEYGFDRSEAGSLPAGWSSCFTGNGETPVWEVREDSNAPSPSKVMVQTSRPDISFHFNVAVDDGTEFSDLEMSVKIEGQTGKIDQGGGLVWSFKDCDNYYVARINPLENNFRVYKVVAGRRIQLQSASLPLEEGRWYVMKVEKAGSKMTCLLDGTKYLEIEDDTFQQGKVGLWTKADAVTSFDDLIVRPSSSSKDES